MPIQRQTRPCPVCHEGSVDVTQLHRGTPCSSCGRLIELRFSVIVGVCAALALGSALAFRADLGTLGFILVGTIVVFTSGYANVLAGYLPLRHYGDSDNIQ